MYAAIHSVRSPANDAVIVWTTRIIATPMSRAPTVSMVRTRARSMLRLPIVPLAPYSRRSRGRPARSQSDTLAGSTRVTPVNSMNTVMLPRRNCGSSGSGFQISSAVAMAVISRPSTQPRRTTQFSRAAPRILSAAIGEMRPACTAGNSAASTVTPTPTARLSVSICAVGERSCSMPAPMIWPMICASPRAPKMPSAIPAAEPRRPMITASPSTSTST